MELLFLVLSILALWLGTEILIKGALNIAKNYNFSHVFIGLTVLAVGTDLPEVVLSINASLKSRIGIDASGVIIGNVLGSAISQISLVLGISGLAGYLTLTKKQLKGEGVIMIISLLLTFLVAYDGEITRIEGYILIIAYLVYYISMLRLEKVTQKIRANDKKNWVNVLYLVFGAGLVILSADLVIKFTLALAYEWGADPVFVSILIIGLGTSLPELAISLNAVLKGSAGLSIGNLIGSNIFDLLMPVGIGAAIHPLMVDNLQLWPDFFALVLLSVMVLIFFIRRKGLQRKEALVLIAFYGIYVMFKLIQNAAG